MLLDPENYSSWETWAISAKMILAYFVMTRLISSLGQDHKLEPQAFVLINSSQTHFWKRQKMIFSFSPFPFG